MLDQGVGTGWMGAGLPYLSKITSGSSSSSSSSSSGGSGDQIAATNDLCDGTRFEDEAGIFSPLYGAMSNLTFISGECRFEFTDCAGNQTIYNETGDFEKSLSASGHQTTVTLRTPEGRPQKIDRTTTTNGQATTDSNLYAYNNQGLLTSVTFQRSVNPTFGIRRSVYTYYEEGEEHGSVGDLKTVTLQLLVGTKWVDKDTSYYRYYVAGEAGGFVHGMKFSLDSEAFERLKSDPQVFDPFLATDAQVAQYADHYFEYNSDQRVTKSVVQAGVLTYLYAYEVSTNSDDYNHWHLKIVETRPDGSQRITYNNFLGQAMLTDLASGSDHWLEYHEYDDQGYEVMHAHPSAVVSYNQSAADLDVVLKGNAGLLEFTTYYTSTTATPTTPGGVVGWQEATYLQEGTGGTAIQQSELTYYQRTAGDITIYPVAETSVFRNDDGSGQITTHFAYEWFTDTVIIQQRTTTLPIVPIDQNGTGSTDTVTEIFDNQSNLIWSRDARGVITYRAYDLPTGAVLQLIQDVSGLKLTLPAGWTTLLGFGLHLITDYEIDPLGRTTQSLAPTNRIDGQDVRTASWSVYKDLDDEMYSGHGYALGTVGEYLYTLVNPVAIQRRSADGRTSDSITAVRRCETSVNCDCDVPDAGEVESEGRLEADDCFPQANWVRWSRTLTDDQSQTTVSRVYFQIPDSGEGILGVHYDQTTYGYDVMNRQNRVVSPTGTISRTVYDVRNLVVSTWLGTNDNGATDSDPTGGGTTGNNLVQISGMQYDDGDDGEDGNLTQSTAYVDASTTRITSYAYDFRDRRITTDGEIDLYEEVFYDNLNYVVRTDRRAATSGGNLIARSETLFDNRGRVYRTLRYGVNPATGTVGNCLVDNTFYDANGNAIKTRPSGSEVFTKTAYNGMGWRVASYVGYALPGTSSSSSSSASGEDFDHDVIFELVFNRHDPAGNLIAVLRRERNHNATGTGLGFAGRNTTQMMWFDGVGRTIASANYGTHGDNVWVLSRPATPPEPSDLILVSRTAYNERGEAFESIDPAGKVDRTYADDAGRTVRTIQNYVPSS